MMTTMTMTSRYNLTWQQQRRQTKNYLHVGRGGSQVVSVLAFYPTIRVRIPLKSTVFL